MPTSIGNKACLSHAHISFHPYVEALGGDPGGFVLPWDRIDALQVAFRFEGIEVTCESKDKWYKDIKKPARPGYWSSTPPPRTPRPYFQASIFWSGIRFGERGFIGWRDSKKKKKK